MREKVVSAAAVVVAIGLLLFFARPTYRQGEPVAAGRRAPDFTIEIDGQMRQLSGLDQVVVLNFWATWCPPCVEEMPSLNRLHEMLGDVPAMVIGISVDDDAEAYDRFLREHGIRFPNLRDPSRSLASAYGTKMYPETYILDRRGRIVRKIIGAQDWSSEQHVAYIRELARRK